MDFWVFTPFDIHYNSIHGQIWEMWYIPIALLFCTPFSPISVFCCETRLATHQCRLGPCLWGICTKREQKVTAGDFAHAFFASFIFFRLDSELNFGIIKGQWKH